MVIHNYERQKVPVKDEVVICANVWGFQAFPYEHYRPKRPKRPKVLYDELS
jgi:hypothetical protein